MKTKHFVAFSSLAVAFVWNCTAHAWGARGHQIVAKMGAELAKEGKAFWDRNNEEIASLSIVPDKYWKTGPNSGTEQFTHWFQIDGYYSNPNDYPLFPLKYLKAVKEFSEKKVVKNGTAIWRSEQFFEEAVLALRERRYSNALEYAGVMAHYVGDLSQPLHVTTNYDGEETGNDGIHKFFESDNLNKTQVRGLETDVYRRARALLSNKKYLKSFDVELNKAIFYSVLRSSESVEKILDTDNKLGRDDVGAKTQLELAKERMADGAATYALFLSRIWKEAGSPTIPSGSIKVSIPRWLAPKYDENRTEGCAELMEE